MSRKTKNFISLVAIFLACTFVIGTLGFVTKGFTERDPENWVLQERNEKNLFDNTRTADKTITDGTGINVTLKKDGSVIVDGKSGASEPTNIELGEITLEPGTYTFTSGYKKAGLYSAYLKLELGNGTKTADFDGYDNIVITSKTTAKVVLVISNNVEFNNATFYPVIAEGTEAVDFYK